VLWHRAAHSSQLRIAPLLLLPKVATATRRGELIAEC